MLRWVILGALVLCGGCEHFYRVSDPSGGKEYFTKRVDEQGSGAVKFEDMRTGSHLTLQSSEVKEIKKADLPADLQTK